MENEFIIDNYFDESYKIEKIQTDNGVGYIVTRGNGTVIIPPNFQETDTIAFMVCGQSVDQNGNYSPGNGSAFYGTGPSGPQLIKKAKDANNPEFPPYAVVISNDDLYKRSDYLGLTVYERGTGLLEDTYNAITKGGAEIKNIGGTMFSNGGYGGLLAMDEFLSKHPDEQFNTRIVLNDAYNVEKIFKQKGKIDGVTQYDRTELNDELTFLKANNAEIVTLYRPKNCFERDNSYHKIQMMNAVALAALGFNSVTIESSAENHQVSPFFDICGWDYFKNGTFSLVGAIGIPLYLYINNKLSYDNNVDLRSIGLLSYDSTLVSSNSDYVLKVMNDIRTKIKQSSFLDFENIKKNPALMSASASSLLGTINTCIDSYYNMVEELLKSLVKETDAIVSYAKTIDDMDDDLKRKAIKL